MSSSPIVKDSLLVILNKSNNFVGEVQQPLPPIVDKSSCRIISSQKCLITTNFTGDSFIISNNNYIPNKISGLAMAGLVQLQYRVTDTYITKPRVEIYKHATNFDLDVDSYSIYFQFF
jgi:hypothetical protein